MAGEADNSEYWDGLARGLGTMVVRPVYVLHPGDATPANREALERAGYTVVVAVSPTAFAATPPRPATPAFGGYVAVPCGSGDSNVYAWWADGSIAMMDLRTPNGYIPLKRPDYATLFPASVAAPFVTAPSNATVGEGPRPEADQPRPDDADYTEYPRPRRGRDD